jgi:mannitol-specific phosphotransferase system IIBC component
MEYVQRLPLILGCLAAIAAGIISYTSGNTDQNIYLRMFIALLVFFIIGIYIKKTILRLKKEVDIKREEEKKIQAEKIESERIAKKAEGKQKSSSHKIDFTVDGSDIDDLNDSGKITNDDFEPLAASKAIRSKIKAE